MKIRIAALALLAIASSSCLCAEEIHLKQVSYIDAETDIPEMEFSRIFWATIWLNPEEENDALALGADGAYLNLLVRLDPFMPVEWSVRNMWVSFDDPELMSGDYLQYQFGLDWWGNGWPLEYAECDAMLSLDPVEFPVAAAADWQPVFVQQTTHLIADGNGTGTQWPDLDPPIWLQEGPQQGNPGRVTSHGRMSVPAADLPVVDEPKMGCVPACHARSLGYLAMSNRELFGNRYPNEDFDDPDYQWERFVRQFMKAYAKSMKSHNQKGTLDNNALSGRQKVHNKEKLHFVKSGMSPDLVKFKELVVRQLDDAIDKLEDGKDVEIYVKMGYGEKVIKHALTVYEIVKYEDGTYRLSVVDDPHQGDGVAENHFEYIFIDQEGYIRGSEDGRQIGCIRRLAWDFIVSRSLKAQVHKQ